MRLLIIGGGNTAEELLKSMDLRKNQVIIVEKDKDKCTDIGSKYDVLVINKDATDVSIYTSDISISDIDGILALTNRDEVNIFALTIAKLYRIPLRIARVNNPNVAELLTKLDLGIPITSPSLIANTVKTYLESIRVPKLLKDFIDFKLYEITLSETDRVVNKKLEELELPEDVRILLLFDGTGYRAPNPEDRLLSGYQLLVLSKVSDVVKIFKG
jgi:trk system potassium uptake protein TrkA